MIASISIIAPFGRLATPTTDAKRLPIVLTNTSGFVYYVAIMGITGTASANKGDVKKAVEHGLNIPDDDQLFNQLLFSKIVPNCRKLGLLDAGDGWLREKYTEIGVIELEHLEDTGEEYSTFSIEDEQLATD